MSMKSQTLKSLGYSLCLVPQALLIIGCLSGVPWLSIAFFFVILPFLRLVVGNDLSKPAPDPSPSWRTYYQIMPRVYSYAWFGTLGFMLWWLNTEAMGVLTYIWFALALWIVCSLNTAVGHELIHSNRASDRRLGKILCASVGYFHFFEEHQSHHKKTGHHHGGDAAEVGTSIYRYAMSRYLRTFNAGYEYEIARLNKGNIQRWRHRMLWRCLIPISVALLFFLAGGIGGLALYLFEVVATAFSVQAITYLQHWGLSEKSTPEMINFGYSWEDGCWMQACVTLNHAYHADHHLRPGRPYYLLRQRSGGLPLPASYPVCFILALFPNFFTRIMHCRLGKWLEDEQARLSLQHNTDCIGVSRLARIAAQKGF